MEEEFGMTRRNTRAALAEIPTRLGELRVSPPPFPIVLAATVPSPLSPATPRNALTPNTRDNTPTNMSSAYLSPTPSPDELVIQQRGRKRMPVTWSPDIDHKKQSPFQPNNRTPPKSPLAVLNLSRNGIVLRSTPKKRLILNDFDRTNGSPKKSDTLESTSTKHRNQSPNKSSPATKKLKVERKISQIDYKIPLELLLKGMTQEQLINIIKGVVDKHPEMDHEIKTDLPVPDLKPIEEKLNYLKRNIFRSLPNSRLTSKTDSPAYTRAVTHVTSFKRFLFEQGRIYIDCQHWQTVLDFAMMAWSYVKATPLWDNPPHNLMRRQCFKFLAGLIMNALKKGQFETTPLETVYETLEGMMTDSDDIQSCLKWLEAHLRTTAPQSASIKISLVPHS